MNLSFKEIKFIIEAIDTLMEKYREKYNELEDIDEDEASDLGNDIYFLESLREDLENNIRKYSHSKEMLSSKNVVSELEENLPKEENSSQKTSKNHSSKKYQVMEVMEMYDQFGKKRVVLKVKKLTTSSSKRKRVIN
jgi:molybdopterin converting factor small subunit